MATKAQTQANRKNAKKSTGPKTAEGKAKAAQNAVKHGLFSQKNVVISENQAEFDHLSEQLMAELAPVGIMESILVERIVSLTWRLKRAERMQNEAIDYKIRRQIGGAYSDLSKSLLPEGLDKPPEKHDDVVLGYIADRDFPQGRTLERLSMYERRFELSLFKTMKELKKLQLQRKAEQVEVARLESQTYHHHPDENYRDEATTNSIRNESTTPLKKQTQFNRDYDELSDFEKREYELLTGNAINRNKPNQSQISLQNEFNQSADLRQTKVRQPRKYRCVTRSY